MADVLLTREEGFAAGLKLLAALPVLRWPLAGAAISILADNLDILVMNYVDLGGGGIRDYHLFDKWSDLFAYVTFFIVALGWRGRDRALAIFLFAVRMAGIALFEVAHLRPALILCPNLFETWFLYVLVRNAWLTGASSGTRSAVLIAMIAGKLAQEWVLHGAQILDRYNLDDLLHRVFGG
jgi:hypothetical protein